MTRDTVEEPRRPGVLLGYGSIGRHHAQILSKRCAPLIVVDPSDGARGSARMDYPEALVAQSLGALGAEDVDFAAALAVIATWGPAHAELFRMLVERGVRRVLCEKPLCTSLAEGREMVELARSTLTTLGTHLHFRYSEIVPGFRILEEDLGLGRPELVLVHGGARCLVTNGIHYVDLVSDLFSQMPTAVTSTARSDSINPRSSELGYYQGTSTWDFGDGRELVISFSNASSLYEQMHVYYRNAVVEFSVFETVTVRHRSADEIERDARVTRAGTPANVVYEGALPGVLAFPARTDRILDEVETCGEQILPPELALEITGACIGSLTSARLGRRVDLPLRADGDEAREAWPIS